MNKINCVLGGNEGGGGEGKQVVEDPESPSERSPKSEKDQIRKVF